VATRFVLASRSPRRRELLGSIVPAGRIVVVPPLDSSEAGFAGLHDRSAIEVRLREIARQKARDVASQIASSGNLQGTGEKTIIIAADTTVVVTRPDGVLDVVGQPPEDESWKATVARWFREYYAGKSHFVQTALCVTDLCGRSAERVVTTEVAMIADVERHLEWYIATGEPRGKAGGYGIQGAGSIFVSQITGSLTNVVGLPLEALLELFAELGIEAADLKQAVNDGT
jgi:nucleoside triphosphate pyrophosphatase